MPTIAQKLCNEIVEPILAASSNEITRSIPLRKSSMSANSNRRIAKPTKSVVIEKKKEISQFEPNSKNAVTKLKSQETVVKKGFIDTGVNTYISGPLRCDNNCVTNVRKRENYCSCKYGQKKNIFKTTSKQAQTLVQNCSRSDKACANCIDTNNCGTQFIENLNTRLRTQISNTLLLKKSNDFQQKVSYRNPSQMSTRISNLPTSSRISRMMCQNGKRWAVSNYPFKGPDF